MVRDAVPEDREAIAKIHAQMGLDYRLPDLEHPLFFVRKVITNDAGEVVGACFLRIQAETYLWLGDLSPRGKLDAMLELQPAVLSEAYAKGIDDIEARLPETVERRFYKRLKQLGWVRNRPGWFPWSRTTHA